MYTHDDYLLTEWFHDHENECSDISLKESRDDQEEIVNTWQVFWQAVEHFPVLTKEENARLNNKYDGQKSDHRSTQMNFLEVTVTENEGKPGVMAGGGEQFFRVSPGAAGILREKYLNQKLIMGIRPEAIYCCRTGTAMIKRACSGKMLCRHRLRYMN